MRCPTRGRIAQNQPASFRKNSARKLQGGVAGRSRTAARILCHARGRQISVGRRSSARAAVSPAARNLAQFLEQTHAALAHLDWKQHALELANVARDWSQRLDAKFSRVAFFALAGRNGCDL
jgi:hypothetical protein